MRKYKLSVSKLKLYQSCPYRFYLRHIKKEPEKEVDVSKVIEEFWTPLAKQAEEYKIEFEPLPPNPTADEVKKRYLELQAKVEGAK